MTLTTAHFAPALPEIFMAVMTMCLLMVGVFTRAESSARYVGMLALATLLSALFLLVLVRPGDVTAYAFPYLFGKEGEGPTGYLFVLDQFAYYMKALVLLAASGALILAPDFLTRMRQHKFEYYVLVVLSVLGMMVLLSANSLLVLYLGLELMSFSLYILCAFQRNNLRSTEAGLKYFVLGSLASGLLLYGISLFYGLTGSLDFEVIRSTFYLQDMGESLPHVVALVMVLSAIAFKLSAVPFHMWTPDVYEGAPTPVTAFMAAVPKIAAFGLLMRLLIQPLAGMEDAWSQVLIALSILTMGVGAFMAIVQTNLKRLLAYSSIGHVGFMLVGLVGGTVEGVKAVMVYLTIYALMTLATFGMLLVLRRKDVFVETLDDIAGLSRQSPMVALAFLVLMFSLAGIPPLAGFFAKFYVFSAAVSAGYTWLAVVGVLFSVVAAYYCLRVVKVMYFDDGRSRFDNQVPFGVKALVSVLTLAVVLFALVLNQVDKQAAYAASSLFTTGVVTTIADVSSSAQ